jgi:hypothetical protein
MRILARFALSAAEKGTLGRTSRYFRMTCFTINIPRWHPTPLNKLMKGHWSNGHQLKVYAGALVDDNRQHVELAPVTFSRSPKGWGTVIRLEDL